MKDLGNHEALASTRHYFASYTSHMVCTGVIQTGDSASCFLAARRDVKVWIVLHGMDRKRKLLSTCSCTLWFHVISCDFMIHLFDEIIWNHQFLPEFPLAALRQTSHSPGCGYLKLRVCKWQCRESSASLESKVATLGLHSFWRRLIHGACSSLE